MKSARKWIRALRVLTIAIIGILLLGPATLALSIGSERMQGTIFIAALIVAVALFVCALVAARCTETLNDQLQRRRHTYPMADGLEDALAFAIEGLLQEELQSIYRRARTEQLRRVLAMLREGPLSYDRERPNGKTEAKKSRTRES